MTNQQSEFGSKTWYFADGWMPYQQMTLENDLLGHESLMIMNCQDKAANVTLDLFYEDKEPTEDILIVVPAKRVKCVRLDHPDEIGGVVIPRNVQYAIRLRSDIEVVIQYGRLDVTQPNLAFMALMGYSV